MVVMSEYILVLIAKRIMFFWFCYGKKEGLRNEARDAIHDASGLFLRNVTAISGRNSLLIIPVFVPGAFSMEEYARLLRLWRQ